MNVGQFIDCHGYICNGSFHIFQVSIYKEKIYLGSITQDLQNTQILEVTSVVKNCTLLTSKIKHYTMSNIG